MSVPNNTNYGIRGALSVRDFQPSCSGATAPLSTRYTTLAAAQAVYPHATALTDEIDWAAAQAGVNYLTARGGGTLQFDGDYFNFNKPLVVLDSVRVHLKGQGHRTQITWNGTSGEAVVVFRNAGHSGMADLNIKVSPGATVTHGVLVTATTSTQCVGLSNVFVQSDGTMTTAFGVGTDTAADVAFTSFFHCTATNAIGAGFRFGNGTTGNVLNTRGFGCMMGNNGYGVYFDGCGGSWYGWGCDTNSIADFYRGQATFDSIVVDGGRTEGSARFWHTAGGNIGQPIVLRGVDCDQFTDAAGLVVYHASQAPLLMQNSVFRGGPVNVTMTLGAGVGGFLSTITAENVATTGTPFASALTGTELQVINCLQIDGDGVPIVGSTVNTHVYQSPSGTVIVNGAIQIANTFGVQMADVTTGTQRVVLTKDNGNVVRLQQTAAANLLLIPGSGQQIRFANAAQTVNAMTFWDTTNNFTIGDNTDANYRLNVSRSGSAGTLQAYDATASTGVTKVNIREGAGQSTTPALNVFANNGTTVRLQAGPDGVKLDGNIGFYGTTPIARQLLATGTGATVDNVITALQALGLLRQS